MRFSVILAGLVLASTVGSCSQPTRIDAIAKDDRDLADRCHEAMSELGSDNPRWQLATLDPYSIKTERDGDALLLKCPLAFANAGQDLGKSVLTVIVRCPADTAIPCTSGLAAGS